MAAKVGIILLIASLALVQTALGIFYIPTTSIDNTQAFYESASAHWHDIHGSIDEQVHGLASSKDYGAYVLMTSIYGANVPETFDARYVNSLMDKLREIGPRTWDDEELQRISATFQLAHQSAYVISAAQQKSAQLCAPAAALAFLLLLTLGA
ncbi:hypothetical protein GGI25_000580 [Coemansia spiralis]|uniref:Uncharacterized protein n=2 Tax=Coemansia TaxID=4863 RepID=A0A9W8GCJ9_9FUNG|nr:hypothetical protein BX070DRAFT_254336 [Coemansia spiralis]KAJ1996041.1 hypothetical protein EDC05_000409 [Coemansia umbellata]KAJ2625482.1 hypothetical protein GGI26_000622 [Coemansia sp. RSA 1358]KAJ2680607.1 hypothetical protein GGI25_000580 [Coemansia spiralis]